MDTRPVAVSIPNRLGKTAAKARIDHGLGRIRSDLGPLVTTVEQHWEGDRLVFDLLAMGQRITGRIEVSEPTIDIEVDLPAIFGLLSGTITRKIRDKATLLLTKK